MKTDLETPLKKPSWLSIGAFLAAIGASICCVGPFLLLSLGIGGAWISTLTAMEPARSFFIILSLIFIGLSYRKPYLTPDHCLAGDTCATPANQCRQRLVFWLLSTAIEK